MRDLAQKWPPAPDWGTAAIEAPGLRIVIRPGLHQCLVSGDLTAAGTALGIASPAVGAMEIASGDRYAVQVARDRMLVVSTTPLSLKSGWHETGFAATTMDAALTVFEISGDGVEHLLARGMTLDPAGKSPSAALLFAGANVFLYRWNDAGRILVHVDRGLAPYLWEWLEQSARL